MTWLIKCSDEELNTIIRACLGDGVRMSQDEREHAKEIARTLIELRNLETGQ